MTQPFDIINPIVEFDEIHRTLAAQERFTPAETASLMAKAIRAAFAMRFWHPEDWEDRVRSELFRFDAHPRSEQS